jgi:oxygen-dependent protoporphyrinogen oxidase
MAQRNVVIIGGGITGLSAAFYLQKKVSDVSITLVESEDRLGGKINTEYHDGFVFETGPDSFLARKKSAAELVKDVGLEDDLVRNRTGQAYVLNDDTLYPIPKGAVMGIPTTLSPFLETKLFTAAGKARAAGDLVLPRSDATGDVSVGNFFRRRLGNELVDRLIEPLLSGIYAGNLDRLSLMSTFPQFHEVEQRSRSLMLGMRESRGIQTISPKPEGQFLTLTRGLQSLVDKLEENLDGVHILKNTVAEKITKQNNGYTIRFQNGDQIEADSIISTVPHRIIEKVLPPHPFLKPLSHVADTTVATVVLAFPESAVNISEEGTGFVVSRKAGYTMTACTWTHKKWPHTTPSGKVLLRCYVGRAGDDTIVDKSDETIVNTVLNDLRRVVSIKGRPDFYKVTRWKQAMPQYIVGHQAWLENLENGTEDHFPGIYFAGASYEGVGIPDCITQGKKAVENVVNDVKQ